MIARVVLEPSRTFFFGDSADLLNKPSTRSLVRAGLLRSSGMFYPPAETVLLASFSTRSHNDLTLFCQTCNQAVSSISMSKLPPSYREILLTSLLIGVSPALRQ